MSLILDPLASLLDPVEYGESSGATTPGWTATTIRIGALRALSGELLLGAALGTLAWTGSPLRTIRWSISDLSAVDPWDHTLSLAASMQAGLSAYASRAGLSFEFIGQYSRASEAIAAGSEFNLSFQPGSLAAAATSEVAAAESDQPGDTVVSPPQDIAPALLLVELGRALDAATVWTNAGPDSSELPATEPAPETALPASDVFASLSLVLSQNPPAPAQEDLAAADTQTADGASNSDEQPLLGFGEGLMSPYGFTTMAAGSTSFSLGGSVRFWADGSRPLGVDITITDAGAGSASPAALTTSTGADGTWSLGSIAFPLASLAASRNGSAAETLQAITSADALAALKLAVGRNPNSDPDGPGAQESFVVSPYQLIAADINEDGRVTREDVQAILAMAAGGNSAPQPKWVFVPANLDLWGDSPAGLDTVSLLTREQATAPTGTPFDLSSHSVFNWIAVLKGDVDGSWSQTAAATSVYRPPDDFGLASGSLKVTILATTPMAAGGSINRGGSVGFIGADPHDYSIETGPLTTIGSALGSAQIARSIDGGDPLDWTYSVATELLAALPAGASRIDRFALMLNTRTGQVVTRELEISLQGTNDVPVVTNSSAARAGTVIEAGYLDDGTVVPGISMTTGTLTASDVDAGATRTWSLPGTPSATYGSMLLNANTGVWTYSLDNAKAATQALKEGESVTQTYVARVTDDGGAFVDQTITITIRGTSDVTSRAGTVVEAGNADDGSIVWGTDTASGLLGLSGSSIGAVAFWTLQGSPVSQYGTMTIDRNTGEWRYTLDNGQSATQALSEGQNISQIYTARATDNTGLYADQTVTLTIKGSNDSPVMTSAPEALVASVIEAGQLDDGSILPGSPSASGKLAASDPDSQARLAWSLLESSGMSYGSAVIDAATGAWSFTLDNQKTDTQGLREGQSATQTLIARVTDEFGAWAEQTLTISIAGNNDFPVISSDSGRAGTVIEAGHSTDGSVAPGIPSVTGLLKASDPDLGEQLIWRVDRKTDPYGKLTLSVNGAWTYELYNTADAVQPLKQGETVTQVYSVHVEDGFGASRNDSITITIQGGNDRPVIENDGTPLAKTVTEAGSTDSGTTTAGISTASGVLSASDPDKGATLSWSIAGSPGAMAGSLQPASSTYGTMSISAVTGVWTYALNNSLAATEGLQESQQVTQSYVARVTDNVGAHVDQIIVITLNGANDKPVVTNTSAALSGVVTEASHEDNGAAVPGVATASGTLSAVDKDIGNSLNWTLLGTPSTTYGTLALNAASGVWTYTLDNSKVATQALALGQTVTQSYVARVSDNFGAYVDQSVGITINGSNDKLSGAVKTTGNLPNGAIDAGYDKAVGSPTASSLNGTRTWSILVNSGTALSASGAHGNLAINPTTGVWTYALRSSDSANKALDDGDVATDTFVIRASNGSTNLDQTVVVKIHGNNDAPETSSPGLITITTPTLDEGGSQKQATAEVVWTDVDDNISVLLQGWSSDASQTSWSRSGNFGTATLSIATNQTTGAKRLTVNYLLDDSLPETNSLAQDASDFDRFLVAVTDGDVISSREIRFTIVGTDDLLSWNPITPGPIVIHRLVDQRAVVRLDASATDPDSEISYEATLSQGGFSSTFVMSASGGSLIGMANLGAMAPEAGDYTLSITAMTDAGDRVSRSFTGTTVAAATPVSSGSTVLVGSDANELLTRGQLVLDPNEQQQPSFLGKGGNDTFEGLSGGYAFAGGIGQDSAIFDLGKSLLIDNSGQSCFIISMLDEARIAALASYRAIDPIFSNEIISGKFLPHQGAALMIEMADGYAFLDAENLVFANYVSGRPGGIDRAFTLREDSSGALRLTLSDKGDRVMLGARADNVDGGAGNDVLSGSGNGGGVLVNGQPLAHDILRGGQGDDILAGGSLSASGDFTELFGDAGDDVLMAVSGTVQATGGSGRDVFALYDDKRGVTLVIRDFNAATDLIDLSGFSTLKTAVLSDSASTQDRSQALLDLVSKAVQGPSGLEINLDSWMTQSSRDLGMQARIVLESVTNGPFSSQNLVLAEQPWSPANWHADLNPLIN